MSPDAHPEASTMGVVGTLALVVNCAVALMLFAHREGDSNTRSVWLCTRNDALGNIAVLLAASGVFGAGATWPDLAVAGMMATLAVTSAFHVFRQARGEIHASHNVRKTAPINSVAFQPHPSHTANVAVVKEKSLQAVGLAGFVIRGPASSLVQRTKVRLIVRLKHNLRKIC